MLAIYQWLLIVSHVSLFSSFFSQTFTLYFQQDGRAYSFCGTIEYMAPEIVKGGSGGHGMVISLVISVSRKSCLVLFSYLECWQQVHERLFICVWPQYCLFLTEIKYFQSHKHSIGFLLQCCLWINSQDFQCILERKLL